MGEDKQGSRHVDGDQKPGSRIQVWDPKSQGPDSSSTGTSERKRIMGIPKESKCKARAWPKEPGKSPFENWGQRQRVLAPGCLNADSRSLHTIPKFHPTSPPLGAELLRRCRPTIRYERTEPSKSSQLSLSRPYVSSRLKACEGLKRCRPHVPNGFQVTC